MYPHHTHSHTTSTYPSPTHPHPQAHSPLDQQHAGRETRVGQKLSRLITRNVIIMALTLVVGVPVFRVLSGGMYAARNVVHAEGLRLAATLYVQQGQQISAVCCHDVWVYVYQDVHVLILLSGTQ